jgi:trk system potassium uptake protein TrkH
VHLKLVQRILGLVIAAFGATMVPPALVGLFFGDGDIGTFLVTSFVLCAGGGALWYPVRNIKRELRLRDGFLVVALFWAMLGLGGAIPFLLGATGHLSFTDSVFESVAGVTTTNASVVLGLDRLSHALLWYRQQLQWLGGIGVIVLAVALFPILGIGGMQLYRGDSPGSVKDEKLTPRIKETARTLSGIYLLITIACALAFNVAGMGLFDAVTHAFSTVSTGGFSTHEGGLSHFQSTAIEFVAIGFMFVGGVNFALHFLAYKRRDSGVYFDDPQFRGYLILSFLLIAVVSGALYRSGVYATPGEALRQGAFAAISMQSTTGFAGAPFFTWPGMLPVLLMLTTFVGGSAGSTSGGMKIIRWQLVLKQAQRELMRLVHPNAAMAVKFGDKAVEGRVLAAITGFFAMYLVLFGLLMLLMMAAGTDQLTAWSAVAACINNTGPGLGGVAVTYAHLPEAAKWVALLAMLIGRLEVFTVAVLFMPAFWRH